MHDEKDRLREIERKLQLIENLLRDQGKDLATAQQALRAARGN